MDLNRWIEQYTTHLLKMSFFYVKDRQVAEDIVQDVFLKLYEQPHHYVDNGNEKAFLVRLTINRSKDYLKSWYFRKMQFKEIMSFDKGYEQSDQLVIEEEQQVIGEAILALPLKYREVLVLHYFEEQTVAEMSTLLQIPLGTVKTRLIKARQLLKISLQKEVWEVLGDERSIK